MVLAQKVVRVVDKRKDDEITPQQYTLTDEEEQKISNTTLRQYLSDQGYNLFLTIVECEGKINKEEEMLSTLFSQVKNQKSPMLRVELIIETIGAFMEKY